MATASGERSVYLDGTLVWNSGALYYYNGANQCGVGGSWKEEVYYVNLEVVHTSSSLTLTVTSTLNQVRSRDACLPACMHAGHVSSR